MRTLKLILTFFIFSMISCSSEKEAEYDFVGKYEYKIVDQKLLSETYLAADSYGYVIGDLNIQGLEILNTQNIENKDSDFIVSLDYPIISVLESSKAIDGESMDHMKKKPLEIRRNINENSKQIYIYRLKEKDKFRLLLP